MKRVAAWSAALAGHLALQSVHVWWVLAGARPLLFLVLGAIRTSTPVTVGWVGLAVGLLEDVLADRVIGPGGIACAVAGVLTVLVARRFELEGPLFWVVGAIVITASGESVWHILNRSLGHTGDHGWLGSLAAVGTTAALAMLLAAAERVWEFWRSPTRRRRRRLQRP
jgi:hypothetical protein